MSEHREDCFKINWIEGEWHTKIPQYIPPLLQNSNPCDTSSIYGTCITHTFEFTITRGLASEIGDKQYTKLGPSFRTLAPTQNVYFWSYNTHDAKLLSDALKNIANKAELNAETVHRRRQPQLNREKSFTDLPTSFSTPKGDLTNTPNTTINNYLAPQSYSLGFDTLIRRIHVA